VSFVLLFQLKGSDTGRAVIKGFNSPLGGPVESFNGQINLAVSRQPQFEKTVLQGGKGLVDQRLAILVNGFYLKRLLNLFPLTGG